MNPGNGRQGLAATLIALVGAILAGDPIKVDPTRIRDVAVLETDKSGKVYVTKQ